MSISSIRISRRESPRPARPRLSILLTTLAVTLGPLSLGDTPPVFAEQPVLAQQTETGKGGQAAGIAEHQKSAQSASKKAKDPAQRTPASVMSRRGVVAADNPVASQVGAQILAEGGNAADAGVATLLANGVLNPFASGLGGGGFCIYRPIETGQAHVIDFRERAPLKATEDIFVVDGEVDPRLQLRGGLAVGVPGEPAGLWALQNRFGALDWPQTVQPAIELANDYEVGELLASRLDGRAEEDLKARPKLAELFQIDGRWARQGEHLKRVALAKTLEKFRDEGPIIFYHGEFTDTLIAAINEEGGIFEPEDLHTYSVENRQPLTGTYRGYSIVSMPPPSSGGSVLLETLNILETFEPGEGARDARAIHRIVEALKHGFADRARWMGDDDFVDVPVDQFVSKDYARELAKKIKDGAVLAPEDYGSPSEGVDAQIPDDDGTSHLSIIDEPGNMLACTSTINTIFGSMVYDEASGIILNNEMGDFTPQPGKPNVFGLVGSAQNAVAPAKRPLSSMTPTLIFRDQTPMMATGGSGGPMIITGTLLSFLNIVDFGMTPVEAVGAPRIHTQWRPETLYVEPTLADQARLEEWGHQLKVGPAFNSIQIVVRDADGLLTGVSDPRKMGAPAAQPDEQSETRSKSAPTPPPAAP